ncbi:MAG: hypothetical protein KME35_00190 [Aphanocapsa sp. GSE-SYN-MK-11-07L]|jgi:hypothetical protein|nr:hypothetical protein [Aphanocapsa sp. GSE-SYN-MK-11-07L]
MNRILLSFLMVMCGAIAACQSNPPISSNVPAPQPAETSDPKAAFDEKMYLFANPDVKQLIEQGKYKSGLDHYTQVGQTTKKPDGEDYESFFLGTDGNDTVQGFGKGKHAHVAGVAFEIVPKKDDPIPLKPKSLGKGEKDILIGSLEGGNEFVLGSFITSVSPKPEPFYVGQGDADFAQVQNFTPSKDTIMLAGQPQQYKFEPKEGNVRISTASGDLVAIVEGVNQLQVDQVTKDFGIFTVK